MSLASSPYGELLTILPPAGDLSLTNKLIHTDQLRIMRMVMPAGKILAEHKAPGVITVHCLKGKINFTSMGKTTELGPGQLLCLPTGELHSVEAIEDSTFLLTIFSTEIPS